MLAKKIVNPKGAARSKRLKGAVRGILSGLTAQGEPVIDYCGNPAAHALIAITTVAVAHQDIGKEAILLFEDGDPARPLLVGIVRAPGLPESGALDVRMDGRCLTFTAEHEISIRCGEASLTLTRAGKVLIKGAYLLSRSTGPNRIKGGSVLLN